MVSPQKGSTPHILLPIFLSIALGQPLCAPLAKLIRKLLPAFALPSFVIFVQLSNLFITPVIVVSIELGILVLPARASLRAGAKRSILLIEVGISIAPFVPVHIVTIVSTLISS